MWSRVGAGSRTIVSPDAAIRRRAGSRSSPGRTELCAMFDPDEGPPVTEIGAWPSSVRTAAPIDRSGAATRSIGRLRRLASPTSALGNGAAARSPASSRIEVPELPQSSRRRGLEPSPCAPHPRPQAFREPRDGVRSTWNRQPPPRTERSSPHIEGRSSLDGRAREAPSRRSNVERARKPDQTAAARAPSRRGSAIGVRSTCRRGRVHAPLSRPPGSRGSAPIATSSRQPDRVVARGPEDLGGVGRRQRPRR